MTTFYAGDLARGWLAVALASSKDADRPALDRTVSIDAFSEGVRLVATDSYVLLRSWIPNVEHEGAPEPDLDEVPINRAVAIDLHGRARGLLGYALGLAARAEKDDIDPVEVRMNLGVVDEVEGSARPSFAGMEVHYVTLEVPDKEKLKLLTYEGDYPSWQGLMADFTPVKTYAVALGPELAGRVAKVGKYFSGPLGLTFGGDTRPVRVESIGSYPHIEGVVMPVRWDVEKNQPMADTLNAEAQADDEDDDPPPAEPMPSSVGAVDELLAEAGRVVVEEQLGSARLIRTRLGISHYRSGQLMAELHARGIVGPVPGGGRPRPVLVEALDQDDLHQLTLPKEPSR